jgi:hypothetical protein
MASNNIVPASFRFGDSTGVDTNGRDGCRLSIRFEEAGLEEGTSRDAG